jgi:hypothetical protein
MVAWSGEYPGGCGAVLAGVEVAGFGDGAGGGVDIGVVEDDHWGFAAEFEVHAFEVVGPGGRDLPAGPDGPGDRDHVRDRVGHEFAAGVPVAADHVEHPAGRCSAMIWAIHTVEAWVVSQGLRTTVLPAARAGANFQIAMRIG